MKIDKNNKRENYIKFIPESDMDVFYIGALSKMGFSVTLSFESQDVHKITSASISVDNLMRILLTLRKK